MTAVAEWTSYVRGTWPTCVRCGVSGSGPCGFSVQVKLQMCTEYVMWDTICGVYSRAGKSSQWSWSYYCVVAGSDTVAN